MRKADFASVQRQIQAQHFTALPDVEDRLAEAAYRLKQDHRALNLSPVIREAAAAYFGPPRNIAWHRHCAHGLSSQVMCLNFLMPLADKPDVLKEIIGCALGRGIGRMLPVEGGPFFVGFEWTGLADYLGEWPANGKATRGANVTSADAVVRFEAGGRTETLLIEWKYTEKYGAPPDPKRQAERIRRYRDKAFHPDGPLRADLGLDVQELFWEPVYQMFRQQMLAFRMAKAREDGADRVSVLHISPRGNKALHKVTAPKLKPLGNDVFEIFRSLLVRPEDFTAATVEDAFGPTIQARMAEPWAAYLAERYRIAGEAT